MSGFEKQTYTQVPNSLFVTMKDMDECELKVVMLICRYTFGYHRDEVKISTRKLAEEIGMNTASVDKGADSAVARGLIERITDGNKTTVWRALVSDSEFESPAIQNLNHHDSEFESLVGVKESIKDNGNKTTTDEKNIFKIYQDNIGSLTSFIADSLIDAEKTYSFEWVLDSIKVAVVNNKRNWSYCEAILRRWKIEGKDDGIGRNNKKGVKHGAQANGKTNHSGNKSNGLSEAGQRAADEINKRRAAKKAAGLPTV